MPFAENVEMGSFYFSFEESWVGENQSHIHFLNVVHHLNLVLFWSYTWKISEFLNSIPGVEKIQEIPLYTILVCKVEYFSTLTKVAIQFHPLPVDTLPQPIAYEPPLEQSFQAGSFIPVDEGT